MYRLSTVPHHPNPAVSQFLTPCLHQCIACPTVCHLSHVPLHHPRAESLTQCVICPTSPSTIPMQCHTVCHLSHVPLHHPRAVSLTQCVICPTSQFTVLDTLLTSVYRLSHSVSFVPRPPPPSPCSVTHTVCHLSHVSLHHPHAVSHGVSFVPRLPPPSPCSVTRCVICPTSPSTFPMQCHTVCHLSHVSLHHPHAVSHGVSFVPRLPPPSPCSVTRCVICPTSPSTIPMQCHTVCHLSHVSLHHPHAVSHGVSFVPRLPPPSPCSVTRCVICPTSPSTIPMQCHTVCHLSHVPLHHPRAVSLTQCVICPTSPSTIPMQCHTVCHLSHVSLHLPHAVSHGVSFVPRLPPPSPCSVTRCVICPTSPSTIPMQCHTVCHLSHVSLHHPHAVSHGVSFVPRLPPPSPCSVTRCVICPTSPSTIPVQCHSRSVSFVPRPPPPSPCSVTRCVICPTSPSTIPMQCHTVCHLSHVSLHHPRAVSLTQCVICPTSPSTIPVQCCTVCHLSHVPIHHPRGVSHSEHLASISVSADLFSPPSLPRTIQSVALPASR